MIYAIGPVSGGHLNPAVTVAVILRNPKANFLTAAYILVQLLAGYAAGLTYRFVCGTTFMLAPVGRYEPAVATTVEVIYAAALCFVFLSVSYVKSREGNQFFGLAIGFTVTAAALAIGGISGCSLNPAVSLGALASHYHTSGDSAWKYLPMYFFSPFGGAIVGAGLFHAVNPGVE